jgi:hypothetical protein
MHLPLVLFVVQVPYVTRHCYTRNNIDVLEVYSCVECLRALREPMQVAIRIVLRLELSSVAE